MKIKPTPLYIIAAIIVMIIFFSMLFTIGSWLGWWGVVDVYGMVWTFIVNWVIVITFAILGGILFGMFVGFKLSTQGFTPFEKSMLSMFIKVEDIQERVTRIEDRLKSISQFQPPTQQDESLAPSSSLPSENTADSQTNRIE